MSDSKEYIPLKEVGRFSATPKSPPPPTVYGNSKNATVSSHIQVTPFHTLPSYFFKIYFKIVFSW